MGERVAPLAAVFGAAILAFLFFELDRMRNGLATNREVARTNSQLVLANARLSATNLELCAMRGDLSKMAQKIAHAKLLF